MLQKESARPTHQNGRRTPPPPSDLAVSEEGVPAEKVAGALLELILLDIEAVKDHIKKGRTNEALMGINSSRSNTWRLGQTVTNPSAQQAVAEVLQYLDELEKHLRSGNMDRALELLKARHDSAMNVIQNIR